MTNEDLLKVAEVEIVYNTKVKPSERIKITSSKEIVAMFKRIYEDKIEYAEKFYVAYLNRANKVLGVKLISTGSDCGTVVCSKMVMQGAILSHCKSIILCHNHPSGGLQPSNEDRNVTKQLVAASKFFGINVLDHVILTTEGYYSFADDGIINN